MSSNRLLLSVASLAAVVAVPVQAGPVSHALAVTPYWRVFFGDTSEVAKLEADGSVKIFVELAGDRVLGLAAMGENQFLLLRQDKHGAHSLESVDPFGNSQVMVDSNQIASVTDAEPFAITNAE